jgi:16S rRNA (cytidine1402-2'-O)-methyltransferase
MLYIIATPIGNLEDISPRALNTLKEADLILAEDTRRVSHLLNHYEIKNRLSSYNKFTHRGKEEEILKILREGKKIALVSDNGTPLVSDPGSSIVRKAHEEGLLVSPVPGPSAVTAALSVSGFDANHFSFISFLPKKEGEKKRIFEKVKESDMTTVFFESPHRIIKTITLIESMMPERKVCLCRELTKKFEQIIYGPPSEILKKLEGKEKGEFTVVVEGK